MNVLLLGNGFDIYHHLPTKYHNFLNVAIFLHDYYNEDKQLIGDIFSDPRLQKKDTFIAKCYESHKSVYDTTVLPSAGAKEIINLCRDNLWFTYFLKSYNKDIGWIDFEKEIAFVLKVFNKFLSNVTDIPTMPNDEPDYRYILNHFNFFVETKSDGYIGFPVAKIKDSYIVEYPNGSKNRVVNKDLIISYLSNELDDLAKALKLYLDCFVNITLEKINTDHHTKKCEAIKYIDCTVSFNYTHTYEKLYSNNKIHHLHGEATKNIILGINSDTSDNINTIDTSFIAFKKYYQRTFFETDHEYFEWINDINETKPEICLTVMGHSLDITDKDILIELFENSTAINIFYHDEYAKKSYIDNLIKMFGKQSFESLRRNQHLRFCSLNDNLNVFANYLKSNSDEEYVKHYCEIL